MQSYDFSIAEDFEEGLDPTVLHQTLLAAFPSKFSHIDTIGDVCHLQFNVELTVAEQITLDALVADHVGIAPPVPDAPVAEDGRVFYAPNIFPVGVLTDFRGCNDDLENGIPCGGDLFTLEATIEGTVTKSIQFMQAGYLAGGYVFFSEAEIGDHISFDLTAPATAGTSNPGAGAYSKVEVGPGLHIYAPGGGDWDLDLSEKFNANVKFFKVVPVPASAKDGFFDWNPDTEIVTVNTKQKGGYNLFDFPLMLGKFVNKAPLLGSDHFPLTVPAVKPIRILAQWQMTVRLYNSAAKTLQAAWTLYRGTKNEV